MPNENRWLTRVIVTAGAAGGISALASVGFMALLKRQAAVARAVIGKPHGEDAHDPDRTYKKKWGRRIELLIVGDSIAAGLGAEDAGGTLGARLARSLSKKAHRAVRLRTVAKVGAETSMLAEQLEELAPGYVPDVAVIVVGGNDVTHRVPVKESVRDLGAVILSLQERGAQVVVGTCPDLGALRPLPQPLRSLGSRASRQLAQAQARIAGNLGATAVPLARAVGPFFVTNPDVMFSQDQFHPSEQGYKRIAKALLPAVLAAVQPAVTLHSLGASAKNDVGTLDLGVTIAAEPPVST